MKTSLFLAVISLLSFFACHTQAPEEKVHNKVTKYLTSTIPDARIYKGMRFGKLDSAFTSVRHLEEYRILDQSRIALEALGGLSLQHPDLYSEEEIKLNEERLKYCKSICDSLESTFNPQFKGWKIQHIYHTLNEKGVLVVNSYIFYFNERLSRITEIEEVYRNLPYKSYMQDPEYYGIKQAPY